MSKTLAVPSAERYANGNKVAEKNINESQMLTKGET